MRRGMFLGLFLFLAFCSPPGLSGGGFALRAGETLRYRIYMAGLALGEESFSVRSAPERNGRRVLLIEVAIDSSPSLLKLLDYHERRTIWWDDGAGVPLAEEASISRRQEVLREEYYLDHQRGSATITRDEDGSRITVQMAIVPGTQTATSLLYYFRRFPWEQGERRISLLGGEGAEQHDYEVSEEKAVLRVPFGRFERTYRLSNRRLNYELWFDQGPGRLPLEIRSRFGFGLAQAKLVEAEGYR